MAIDHEVPLILPAITPSFLKGGYVGGKVVDLTSPLLDTSAEVTILIVLLQSSDMSGTLMVVEGC